MTSRLLLVEPSTTMRFVLDNYVQSLGHTVVSVGDYQDAVEALRNQFQSFDNDFDAIILGWPSIAVREADALTALIEQDDFHGLPVVVMSTDLRAETRAWVADRPNSAMLAWKSYESIGETLKSLVKTKSASPDSVEGEANTRQPVKFDNSDIGVLLIDDSPSIRESLTNVLKLHGYRIQAVASRREALEVIHQESIDIAIVDFYLQDETGDEVCRDIINLEPAIICAILTSAYSDPIIKLSLRAGAVDCFFKNEAGELLLARIDALSRVVRQRKALSSEQVRLDRLVDTLAGATLLIDESDHLTYVSEQAATQLGFVNPRELVGQKASNILDPEKLKISGTGRHEAQWVSAEQETIDVVYRLIPLTGSTERMLNFKHVSSSNSASKLDTQSAEIAPTQGIPTLGAATGVATLGAASVADAGSAVPPTSATPSIDGTADPLLHQLIDYLDGTDLSANPVSVLVVGVMFRYHNGTIVSVGELAELDVAVHDSVMAIYQRENHVAQLANNRYGFLLRHADISQSYLLTRKIMQLCNSTPLPAALANEGALCVNGCLLGLANHQAVPAHDVLSRALSGLRAVDVRGVNQALLLDLKRMLPVYPANR